MIDGFEDRTQPLSSNELEVIMPIIIRGLESKTKKSMAVTNAKIREGMSALGHDIPDSRVRKIINHIRMHSLIPRLCACQSGYWVEHNNEELKAYIKSLRQRAASISAVAATLEKSL